MKAVVIGAGAFGGWTATWLQERGARVTLIDAWGPGNSRSSSGGETRIIRCMYGADTHSTKMATRAMELWKSYERRWNKRLLYPSGMLLMAGAADEFISSSKSVLHDQAIQFEELSPKDAERRFPQICFDRIGSVLFEPGAGLLTARENCRTVVQEFVAAGGEYRTADIHPDMIESRNADVFVFACGPWLPKLFPDLLGGAIRPTKQDVLFFAPPTGNTEFGAGALPIWADRTSEGKYYGTPDLQHRGFKIAADVRGQSCDPDTMDRTADPNYIAAAREYVGCRFPALRNAALSETRVCQYENTPDFNFIIDRHPGENTVWLVGGGSGHGYKHGPALGEYVADLILEGKEPDPIYRLNRFGGAAPVSPLSSF